jgi:putative heme-binding domain-containing protein
VKLALQATLFILALAPLQAADNAKVVFIHGKRSHGTMAHEHRAGSLLLAKALTDAKLGINAQVLPEMGYPSDPAVLADAATIVIFCTGHQGHLLNPKLDEFDALMKKGTGVIMIHWATEAVMGNPGKKFLEWMGGYCALNWSVNPHWSPNFTTFPDHPIARGLTPFSLDDEWYYHMRFVPDLKGVTPILSALPGPETLERPDGDRSGNSTVRKAVANGESQHVAWAYERPDGKGRGFGFTGAHNHVSWQNDNFRKVVLNAILWTAHVDVPQGGVPSIRPTDEEIHTNLDDKGQRKKPKPSPAPKKPEPPKIQELDEVREQNVQTMDADKSLQLLTKTLSATTNPNTQAALLKGIAKGLEGQRDIAAPATWPVLARQLSQSPNEHVRRFTDQLNQVFGDEDAIQQALITVADSLAPVADRQLALASLVTQQHPDLLPLLIDLVDEDAMRIPAIRAYGAYESKDAPEILFARRVKFEPESQRAIYETLATRKSYAQALHKALENKSVPKDALPFHVRRSLSALLGDSFTQTYGVEPLSQDKETLIAEYKAKATPVALAKADASSGRVVYQNLCGACHLMYGEGGIIGPDLTGSNRADLNYLLLNVLDPSGDIPDAYRMVTITTKNGQVLAGTVTEEDNNKVVLSMIGQKSTIAKRDIAKRDVSEFSMMPEGQMQTLTDEQVLDLFKYLQTKQPAPLPE